MDSLRQKRVDELIKRELGEILLKDFETPEDSLVTILGVQTSSDLSESKVLVSIFPLDRSPEIFSLLKKRIGFFQRALNRRVKMKAAPRLKFHLEKI